MMHYLAYPLVAVVCFLLGNVSFWAWHRGEVARVQDELRRLQPLLGKALEAQESFEKAHEQTTRLHQEQLHKKWVGNKSGIISLN